MPRQRRAHTEKSRKFKYKNRNQINKTTNQKLPAHELTVCRERRKKGKTVTFSLLVRFVGVAFLLPPFQLGHTATTTRRTHREPHWFVCRYFEIIMAKRCSSLAIFPNQTCNIMKIGRRMNLFTCEQTKH